MVESSKKAERGAPSFCVHKRRIPSEQAADRGGQSKSGAYLKAAKRRKETK